jgi:hypothetical protein
LREKAIALFDALIAHPPFRQVFTQIVEQLRGKGLTQTPGSSDEPRWLRMAAANVVNNLAGDLDSHFEDYVLWNTGHLEFKAAAPRQYVAPLQSTKAHFEHTVRATREKLAQMRRSLSREHDIPVVPSGSFG